MPAFSNDTELIHAARAGDTSALAVLLEQHRASLHALALSILGDSALAHDIVQDSFLTALRQFQTLRDPAAAGAWLRAIVRNNCRMWLRSRREFPGEHFSTNRLGEPNGWDVEEAFDQMTVRDWVWTALDDLPADLRVAVMLRYFTRRTSYAEIAQILDVPIGTVKSRLNQAKKRLINDLLAMAGAAHRDHAELVAERWQSWTAIINELEVEGRGRLYASDCATDIQVEAPEENYRARGIRDHQLGLEASAAEGVGLTLTDIIASDQITIIEGVYRNPPHDPNHCPETHTEVRIHPNGQSERLILYFGDADWAEETTA